MNCVVAMSGGVDSSAALLISRENYVGEGDRVVGLTLALAEEHSAEAESDRRNAADARDVCERQGVAHTSLYAYPEFRERVVRYFTSSYLAGKTPNPCVVCNREIKFGLLTDWAEQNGYECVVTGHYARTAEIGGYTYIKRAVDLSKDQSYVLAMLSQKQLRAARFPLGGLTKSQVREIAASHGFANAHRRDSQDICFIPDGDYVGFMEKNGIALPGEGNYLNENGDVIGRHKGHVRYTVGQRRGLGISLGRHAFVLSKNAAANEVTLGDETGLYRTKVELRGLNLPSDPGVLDGEAKVAAKLRYAHKPSAAVFTRTGESEGYLTFDELQRAPTAGQFAVMYTLEALSGCPSEACEAVVLGAGTIAG